MSSALPWYKRDVDAWRGGTRGMDLELRGFYSELLDAMWDAQGPIPNDDRKLAMMVCCNVRTVRKLLPQLIARGKVKETPEGLVNERMSKEIGETASRSIRSQFDRNSKRIRPEFDAKNPKNPTNSTRDLEVEEELRNKKEEDSHLPMPEKAEARACEFPSDLVEDVKGWIGNGITDAGARHWLQTVARMATPRALEEAHSHTVKAWATGVVRDPASYFRTTAERVSDGKPVKLPKISAREALAQLEAENV